MRHSQETQELLEDLDIIDERIKELKRQRAQIDEWIIEAFHDQKETIRALSQQGIEPEYA